jgi:uncharacterized phage protein gp47/JayE
MTTIPTIQQIYDQLITDIQTEYGITISPTGKVFLRAHAATLAAQMKLYYLQLGLVQKNIAPDTADSEANGGTLERWGRIKMNRNPFTATQGQYACTVTGTAGAVIPVNTTFQSDDDSLNPGILYILDTAFTFVTGTGSITLRALTSGSAGQLQVGNTLTATAPIINVDATATVTAESTAPTDAEDIEVYRDKVLESFRLLPQGGASADYRIWGKENISGVAQIYPYAKSGVDNEINVYIEALPADSTDGKGTPTGTIITNVTNAIEAVRPLVVFEVHYLPVSIINVTINIAGSVFTTAEKALILTALTEDIALIRPFIAGADVVADRKDTLSVNGIINVILNTIPGASFGTVTLYVPDSPPTSVSEYQFDNGEIPYLLSVTYV